MQNPCMQLANTGQNEVLVLALAAFLTLCGIGLLVGLKRGYKPTFRAKFVTLLVVGVLISFLGMHHYALAAPASCSQQTAATPTSTPAVVPAGQVELANDNISTNGMVATFNILDNDSAPSGDPIDPSTIRLTGVWPETSAVSDAYAASMPEVSGIDLWILNPSDSTNPTGPNDHSDPDSPLGEIYFSTINGDGVPTSGEVEIDIMPPPATTIADGTQIHFTYTAKTMSGVEAQTPGVVTVTIHTPTVNDDSYTFTGGSSTATIDAMANDVAAPGSTLDPFSIQFVVQESGPGGTYTAFEPSYSQSVIEDDPDAIINWSITEDNTVSVNYGPNVPSGSYTIQYTVGAFSNDGVPGDDLYGAPATITITIPPKYPPTLVDDSYQFAAPANWSLYGEVYSLPILANDIPHAGDSMDGSTTQLIDPELQELTGSYSTNTIPGDNDSFIKWSVPPGGGSNGGLNGAVTVTAGPHVPTNTPFTIQYTANSVSGGAPAAPATITFTINATPTNPISVTQIASLGSSCGYGDTVVGDTFSVADAVTNGFISTTIGSIDPSTVDLDPFTLGRQTSFTNANGTIVVDNSGVITLTSYSGKDLIPFFFTVMNTNGDTSNPIVLTTDQFTGNCG